MRVFRRAVVAVSVGVVLAGCSSTDTPTTVTETVTATVAAEPPATAEPQESAAPTTSATSTAQLRALVEDAVADSDFDLTAQMCDDWVDRRGEILELMTDVIIEGLEPFQPGDPEEVKRVSAGVIREHVDRECGLPSNGGEATDAGSMAAVAGLDDCREPWTTTDHVGNDFTVTLCGTPDDQAVSLYEYDRSQYAGMRREYTETTHVTATWAVAASTDALLDEVVGRLEAASWPPSAAASRASEPTTVPRQEPPAPKSGTEGWDVVKGDHYATVTDCPLDQWGDPVATVKVLNNGSGDADVVGVVEVIDTTTDERVSEMYFYAERVKPGQTVSTEAVGLEGVPDRYICAALDLEPVE